MTAPGYLALGFTYLAGLLTTPVATLAALAYWATRPSKGSRWPQGRKL